MNRTTARRARLHLLLPVAAGIATALAAATPAQAHHSFAMSANTQMTLKGTVRTYEWSHPHTWLWVYATEVNGKPVSDPSGKEVWGFEGTAPSELERAGQSKHDFKPGDQVTVTFRPLKSGQHGGSLGKVVFADGHVIGGGGIPGGGRPGAQGGAGGPPPGAGGASGAPGAGGATK